MFRSQTNGRKPTRRPLTAVGIMLIGILTNCCSGQSSPGYASGGLGLDRRQWEHVHGRAVHQTSAQVAYPGDLLVRFGPNCWEIVKNYEKPGIISQDAARGDSRQLIPNDSVFVRTMTEPGTVDLYRSESLKGRFSAYGDDHHWVYGQPGDFVVEYKYDGDQISGFTIMTGNNVWPVKQPRGGDARH